MNCRASHQTDPESDPTSASAISPADDDGRMIAAAMVAPEALYVEMRRVRCGLYRHHHVRGMMNPLGKRSRPTFTGRG
jgi:hypothetical protein